MPIDVKQFDGVDLPEWMDEPQANLICSFLNSLHSGGSQGVTFHVLNRYPSKKLYLHLINRDRLPDSPQEALYYLVTEFFRRT